MSLEQPVLRATTDSSASSSISSSSPTPAFTIMGAPTTTRTFLTPSAGTLAVSTLVTTSDSPPLSVDDSLPRSPPFVVADTPNGEPECPTTTSTTSDVDPQILEALRSKDRLYVLKLGELMEGLINDRRPRVDLTPSTSYQRLLVHRCSAYYRLSPENDLASKGIFVLLTAESRIPARRLSELVPAEQTALPAFKIMRRTLVDRKTKPQSQTGSVAGEDADFSDVEPSESSSLGGRSSATGGSSKKRMTIEEREAAYKEARSRIFMGFEEKEKEKEKDMSASSSSLSLVSGSASTSGGGGSSSVGDPDDSVSSPATESEWSGPSGPITRDKKEGRLPSGTVSMSSSRSLRSTVSPYSGNGFGSSRNSRAASPAFTYASLYEPPGAMSSYDTPQHSGQGPGPGLAAPYAYPYPPPGPPPNPGYINPYQFYPPYNPYQPPFQPPHSGSSDEAAPSSGEMYSQPQPGYNHPYIWPHSNQNQLPPQVQQHLPQLPPQPHQNFNHVGHPSTPGVPQYPPYMPAAPYPPHLGYYTPQPGQPMVPPPPNMNTLPMYDIPRSVNGNHGPGVGDSGGGNKNVYGTGSGTNSINHGRPSFRNTVGPGVVNGGGKQRGPQPRASWSYGPGIGTGGYNYNSGISAGGMGGGGEVVGPRLSSTRRPSASGASVGSSGTNKSSNCDEASSNASSSTTSSSSRRTYTSTTSSQHPLPPRPDWAVGLKAQPMLHSNHNRHHDHSLTNPRNMSPISPPRNPNGNSPNGNASLRHRPNQQVPPVLQATDFPPLTSFSSTTEKRVPAVAGAWTNSSSTRSILMPSPGQSNSAGSALVYHPMGANSGNARLEEPDRGCERPPPKGNIDPQSVEETSSPAPAVKEASPLVMPT